MLPKFVIYSLNEANTSEDRPGFWSNEDGWTTFEDATQFDWLPDTLPMCLGNDARVIAMGLLAPISESPHD